MTQFEIDQLVAAATGETVDEIQHRGFGIADPEWVDYDPEPRWPLALDANTASYSTQNGMPLATASAIAL